MKLMRGITVPLVTPLDRRGALDERGLARLAERLIGAGVHALMVGGTTGEGMALPLAVLHAAFDVACAAAAGRVPVMCTIGSVRLDDVLRNAERAQAAGATALALQPPPYFPLDDDGVLAFYRRVLPELDRPLFLYHYPQRPNALSEDAIAELAGEAGVAGLKDRWCDFDSLRRIVQRCGGDRFTILTGDTSRIGEALELGADGAVCGFANVAPELCVRCAEATWRGDRAAAAQAQRELNLAACPMDGMNWPDTIRWMKRRLAADGTIATDAMAGIFPGGGA